MSTRLQEDIVWRIRELSEVVRACADGSVVRRSALARSAIPVIYAHWEGYFVVAANTYLQFLSGIRMPMSNLRDEFWALSIRKRFKTQQIGGDNQFNRFLLEIRSDPDRLFKRGSFDKINGRSNLNSEVLSSCCNAVAIPVEPYKQYFDFIDRDLIAKRNHIAHGESLKFPASDVGAYRDSVVELLRITQTQFENASVSGDYLKKAGP
ncbi:hypothetical protein JMM51_13335 [Rhodovulum sulfidophilum]|nr:hypothetical protein [Rhodovulum sulfidophilum]